MGYYYNILKTNSEYTLDNNQIINFEYQNQSDQNLKTLRKKYNLHEFLELESEYTILKNILHWVYSNLIPGDQDYIKIMESNCHSLFILEQTKTTALKCNCLMYSVVLNEIFLSLGFKSRCIICKSIDTMDRDSHCVCIVYSEFYKKWILMDPSHNAIFFNKFGIPLSLAELRLMLINKERYFIPFMDYDIYKNYQYYLYKNFIKFYCPIKNRYNAFSVNASTSYAALYPPKVHEKEQSKDIMITTNPNVFFAV